MKKELDERIKRNSDEIVRKLKEKLPSIFSSQNEIEISILPTYGERVSHTKIYDYSFGDHMPYSTILEIGRVIS